MSSAKFGVTVFLVKFFALSSLSIAGPLSLQDEANLVSAQWKLPAEFTTQRIENLLNVFCRKAAGEAFRFMGVEEDFFHGHVLFEMKEFEGRKALFPVAILYHTQEEAHKAHWEKSIDSQFDYINVTTRNWIQWLEDDPQKDGQLIENARIYLDVNQKDPSPFFDERAEPNRKNHYTIHAKNLDRGKLGFKLAGELQFEFYQDPQKGPSFAPQKKIRTECLGQESVLHLFTSTFYLDRS